MYVIPFNTYLITRIIFVFSPAYVFNCLAHVELSFKIIDVYVTIWTRCTVYSKWIGANDSPSKIQCYNPFTHFSENPNCEL